MTTIALPTFQGYTVDVRLKQFRRVTPTNDSIQFIPFDSEEGDELLAAYIETLSPEEFAAYVRTLD